MSWNLRLCKRRCVDGLRGGEGGVRAQLQNGSRTEDQFCIGTEPSSVQPVPEGKQPEIEQERKW